MPWMAPAGPVPNKTPAAVVNAKASRQEQRWHVLGKHLAAFQKRIKLGKGGEGQRIELLTHSSLGSLASTMTRFGFGYV